MKMCLAVPVRLISIEGSVGKVELSGTVMEVGLQLLEEAAIGDYVLVHAGFAIQKVDQREAEETLRFLNEVFDVMGKRDEVR